MLDPAGRVVMVSGANRGIGRATALTLDRLGYQLSLGARRPGSIPEPAESARALHCEWHAESAEESIAWVRATLARYGRIDGLVMNAGIELGGALLDGDEDAIDAMFDVNFKGPLRLFRAALPALRESGSGRIVNVVSLAGKRVLRHDILGYAASKHAAMALTHAIRQACWKDGIRATAVCPGLVETDMTAHASPGAGQFKIEPETIAETVAYALALPNSASVAEILVNSRYEPLF